MQVNGQVLLMHRQYERVKINSDSEPESCKVQIIPLGTCHVRLAQPVEIRSNVIKHSTEDNKTSILFPVQIDIHRDRMRQLYFYSERA